MKLFLFRIDLCYLLMAKFIDNSVLESRSVLPWTEKYRPNLINQIVSHETILRIMRNQINRKNFPNVMFYGPPGTGKTTTIHACAREMFGEKYMDNILELNGSNDRGICVVREKIDTFAQHTLFTNTSGIQKLVILDEVDSMTQDAQTTLQSIIEKYTDTTRFCLICNYKTKIINALCSLSCIFLFKTIPENVHRMHLRRIIQYEQMNIVSTAIDSIVRESKGDMRQSINVLQSLSMIYGNNEITNETVYECICQTYPDKMNNLLRTMFNAENTFETITEHIQILENTESVNINSIIGLVTEYIISTKIFSEHNVAKVLIDLADVERSLAIGATPQIQTRKVASIIYKANTQSELL